MLSAAHRRLDYEYREGRFSAVPIMLGTNRDEMKLFLFSDEDHVRERFGMFFRVRDPDDYERRSRYHSDLWTVRGVTRPASAISDSGMQDVFAYRFDWDELPRFFGGDLAVLLGAAHGFEVPFVFGTFDLGSPLMNRLIFNDENAAMREALSATMMGYWAEFARHGRPGRGSSGDQPTWEAWTHLQSDDTEIASMLILDAANDGGIRLSQSRLSRDHVIAAVDADRGSTRMRNASSFKIYSRSVGIGTPRSCAESVGADAQILWGNESNHGHPRSTLRDHHSATRRATFRKLCREPARWRLGRDGGEGSRGSG